MNLKAASRGLHRRQRAIAKERALFKVENLRQGICATRCNHQRLGVLAIGVSQQLLQLAKNALPVEQSERVIGAVYNQIDRRSRGPLFAERKQRLKVGQDA